MLANKDYTSMPEKEWRKIDPPLLPPRDTFVQACMMENVSMYLDKVGFLHWLGGGELVCIFRDGKLLPHNQDIDFMCYAEDMKEACEDLKKYFLDKGYAVRASKGNTRLDVFKQGELVSLEGYVKKGKYRWLKNRKVPCRFFETPAYVSLNGMLYLAPGPIEEYLSWRYSNWKKEYSGDSKKRDKYINKKKLMGK